jgi:hypothetical protein
MKKTSVLLFIGLLVSFAFATHDYDSTAVSVTPAVTPGNVKIYELNTRSTNHTKDTLLTTRANFYGPYELSAYSGGPMAKYITVKADAITGTTPEMGVFISAINGVKMRDTVTFDSICQLGTSPIAMSKDISAYAGKSIVVKVRNHDGTTCAIPGYLGIGLKWDQSIISK